MASTPSPRPLLVLVGTRPEAIKLAPVVRALERRSIPHQLVSTGQHRELLDSVLADLGLHPARDLETMRPDQSLAGLSARVLERCDQLFEEARPSGIVVQGDTTTVAMASLAAFYRRLPVTHVEAGLRTHRRYDPFPEEMNRTLVARLATLHLAPTPGARDHLLAEGVSSDSVVVTGNTVIDSLLHTRERVRPIPAGELGLPPEVGTEPFVLVTAHRRENLGDAMRRSFRGLRRLAESVPGPFSILYPVHLNPRVTRVAEEELSDVPGVRLVPPVGYRAFVKLLTEARMVVTDSGGVQEEATALGVPTLVTRETSERPEALEAGITRLVGTDGDRLVEEALAILGRPRTDFQPSEVFGDGRAGERAVEALVRHGLAPASSAPEQLETMS